LDGAFAISLFYNSKIHQFSGAEMTENDSNEGSEERSGEHSEYFRPINIPRLDLSELLPKSAFEDITRIVTAYRQAGERVAEAVRPMADAITSIAEAARPFTELLVELSKQAERSRRIEASGWLPHYTTPFADIHDSMAREEISAAIEAHYRENWPQVESAFLKRLEASWLDDEAKATFKEALSSHGHGLYRTVPRTLFPEIERVAAVELYQGKRRYRSENANGKFQDIGITSLPTFAETVGQLPLRHVMNEDYGHALYSKLKEHLYQRVHTSAEIENAAKDPVPNRHASLHGILTYTTMQNSLNALIMTDYVFHLMRQIKVLSAETDDDA
jgi:hypothetical protein